MLSAAVCAFAVAAFCILYQAFRELSTSGEHFTGAGAGTSNGGPVPVVPGQVAGGSGAGSADAQLQALQQILAALNAQNSGDSGGGGGGK